MPPSPTRSPDKSFLWWQSLLFAVVLFLAVAIPGVFVLVFFIVTGLASVREVQTLSWQTLVAQLAGYAAMLGVMAPLLPLLARRSWHSLGLRAPRPADIGWGILGAIAMVILTAGTGAAQDALFHLKPDEVQVHWLRAARGSLVGEFVFFACVAGPFVEELTFRGFIFNALRRYFPAWAAIVMSAIVFGLSHAQPGNAGAIVPLIAGGAVLAFVYSRTGSLVASMVTHAAFNTVTVVAVLVLHQA